MCALSRAPFKSAGADSRLEPRTAPQIRRSLDDARTGRRRILQPGAGSSRWEGRMDPAARTAIDAAEPVYDDMPPFSDADLERARAAAEVVRAGGDEASGVSPHDLAALSPDDAARLVEDLAAAGRTDALTMVVTATPPHRYPLTTLLRTA